MPAAWGCGAASQPGLGWVSLVLCHRHYVIPSLSVLSSHAAIHVSFLNETFSSLGLLLSACLLLLAFPN